MIFLLDLAFIHSAKISFAPFFSLWEVDKALFSFSDNFFSYIRKETTSAKEWNQILLLRAGFP